MTEFNEDGIPYCEAALCDHLATCLVPGEGWACDHCCPDAKKPERRYGGPDLPDSPTETG